MKSGDGGYGIDKQRAVSEFSKEFEQKVVSASLLADASWKFQASLSGFLLSTECAPASIERIESIFGTTRLPGTLPIGRRIEDPALFQDTLDSDMETYDAWLFRNIESLCNTMRLYRAVPFGNDERSMSIEDICEKIAVMLAFQSPYGSRLDAAIPVQMYEDIFIRMISMIVVGKTNPEQPFLYRELNAIGHRIACALLYQMENRKNFSTSDQKLQRLIHAAVLSGYVGINLKTSASAASTLLNRELIPIEPSWISSMKRVFLIPDSGIQKVVDRMLETSKSMGYRYGIDSLSEYWNEVVDTREDTLLVFFSDDYIESLIDMKRFEIMLDRNPNLHVLFVPRNGRYGNDFAVKDAFQAMDDPLFYKTKAFRRQGRFTISLGGPMAGCIDPRFISERLVEEIGFLSRDRQVILETKGCRNFEMLRGQLLFPWYTSFNCNRALSIRTVGIDIDPVFLRIPPGENAYDGFDDPVIGDTPSGQTRNVRFARSTTIKLYEALS